MLIVYLSYMHIYVYAYRLQKELDSCKECHEEATCQALTKELEDLQRQCYHKQMRQQLGMHGRDKRDDAQTSRSDGGRRGMGRSGSFTRRPGHYNPYTHQYVPAPSINSGSGVSSRSVPATTSNTQQHQNKQGGQRQSVSRAGNISLAGLPHHSIDTQHLSMQRSPDSAETMNIIEDDWLVSEDEEEGEVEEDTWGVELDEGELASLDNELHNDTIGSTSAIFGDGNDSEDELLSFSRSGGTREVLTKGSYIRVIFSGISCCHALQYFSLA